MGRRCLGAALAVLAVAAACGRGDVVAVPTLERAPLVTTTTTLAAPPTTTTLPTTTTTSTAPTATTAPAVRVTPSRVVVEQAWVPFATVGGVVLRHPSHRVERVGFHESNHDGAQPFEPLPSAVGAMTLESRERGTAPRSAADIVVDPATEIRSPVTGIVVRAGTYTLYCDHRDDYAVIEPEGRPGWEVKVLHIDGVRVRPGMRVVAGDTVLAGRATQLPFASQVDEVTATPAWPHVHVEVVDPTVPDRPSPGGGCR